MRKVGVVLGGGGPKCLAHLGMFEVLLEHGIKVDYIIAASSGSLIASLIANKVPIEQIKHEFFRRKIRKSWNKIRITKSSLIDQPAIKMIMSNLLVNRRIEKSPIKLGLMGSDINSGKEHLFERGNIIDAAIASAAWPGLFYPYIKGNKVIIDGGLLNTMPADICKKKLGKNSVVITSSLEMGLKPFELKNPFETLFRSIYIPLIMNRDRIIKTHSDIILEHFQDMSLTLSKYLKTNKYTDKKLLEHYYRRGREVAESNITKIKRLINKKI